MPVNTVYGPVQDLTKKNNEIVAPKDKVAENKNAFLQMLVAQLKNQDPMSPMDNKDFLAQMAQFTTVEEIQNLNQNMEKSHEDSQLFQTAVITVMTKMQKDFENYNAQVIKKLDELKPKTKE